MVSDDTDCTDCLLLCNKITLIHKSAFVGPLKNFIQFMSSAVPHLQGILPVISM